MTKAADWLTVEEALEAVLAACRPLGEEELATGEARGRACAEEVRSRVDHPPWRNSAMDGYAVRAEDVAGASEDAPTVLPVPERVPAGAFPAGPLRPGTAVEVMTGAPVPEGTTGVVRVEHTGGETDGRVAILRDDDARRNVREAGEDVRRGDVLLRPGDELGAAAVGLLALTGRTRVRVGRRPRVGVLATGDELAGTEGLAEAEAGRRLLDSNGPALRALAAASGAVPVALGIARDRPSDLRERIRAGAECDALISTGGVSVGGRDHVQEVLEELGFRRRFWRVRVRPGSALLFGLLDGRPVWGLPGNPVSALVGFEVFVRPGLRRLAGHAAAHRRRFRARAAEPIRASPKATHFLRVRLAPAEDGGPPLATLTGPQGSGILTSVAAADGLLVLPEGKGALEAGEAADVVPLRAWSSGR